MQSVKTFFRTFRASLRTDTKTHVKRGAAVGLLALAGVFVSPDWQMPVFALTLFVCLAVGPAVEFTQSGDPSRFVDPFDAFATTAGASAVWFVIFAAWVFVAL